jgi:hypothetical protein
MPEVAIFVDTRGLGRCRSCGAQVEWAETLLGKRIPFNPPITVQATTENFSGRRIQYIDTRVTPTHFQTCPDAEKWRKRQRK